MSTDRLQYLLEKLFHHTCSDEEKEELSLWIDTLQDDEEWKNRLSKIWNSYEPFKKMESSKADSILKEILKKENNDSATIKSLKPKYSSFSTQLMRWSVAAAAIIGVLIILSVVFLSKKPLSNNPAIAVNNASKQNDIRPGGNKATLTLANGKTIILDSVNNGLLASQNNSRIIKINSGLLKFSEQGSGNASTSLNTSQGAIEYNTITTPLGGQYQIILPDGSEVWLNAGSSLKFPVAFSGNERKVTVSGEAYFEIAKNPQAPFIVTILSDKGQSEGNVEVLGTAFNINAYSGAAVKTTLINGSVKVLKGNSNRLLSPGEQAEMQSNNFIKVNKNINLDQIIAWKNGLFDFEGNDIENVMQEIAKWYNVEVNYEAIPAAHFVGTISRNVPISEVLKMLEMTGTVHFKVEGRTVTVTK